MLSITQIHPDTPRHKHTHTHHSLNSQLLCDVRIKVYYIDHYFLHPMILYNVEAL